VVLVGLVGAAAWLLLARPEFVEPPTPAELGVETTPPEPQPLTLYFGDREGKALVAEQRDLVVEGSTEARVEAALAGLADGPQNGDAVRTLPAEARVRRVFLDEGNATLYLDFDPALVTHHPGGSAAEHGTLGAIVRTIGTNFPDVARLQILVDGQPVETLAGHFDTSNPIEIRSWR
jgi:spore germination protein GerM